MFSSRLFSEDNTNTSIVLSIGFIVLHLDIHKHQVMIIRILNVGRKCYG